MSILEQSVPGPQLTTGEVTAILAYLRAGASEDPPVAFLGMDEVVEVQPNKYELVDVDDSLGQIEQVVLKFGDGEFVLLRRDGKTFRVHEMLNASLLATRH